MVKLRKLFNNTNKPVLMLALSFSLFAGCGNESEVVQNGTMDGYPQSTVGNIMDANFENGEWDANEVNGKKYVKFTGEINEYLHKKACRLHQGSLNVSTLQEILDFNSKHPLTKRYKADYEKLKNDVMKDSQDEDWNSLYKANLDKYNNRIEEFEAPLNKAKEEWEEINRSVLSCQRDIHGRLFTSYRELAFLTPLKSYNSIRNYKDSDNRKEVLEKVAEFKEKAGKDPCGFLEVAPDLARKELLPLVAHSEYIAKHVNEFIVACEKVHWKFIPREFNFTAKSREECFKKLSQQLQQETKLREIYEERSKKHNAKVDQFNKDNRASFKSTKELIDDRREKYAKCKMKLRSDNAQLLNKYVNILQEEYFWPVGSEVNFEWVLYADGTNFEFTKFGNELWAKSEISATQVFNIIYTD